MSISPNPIAWPFRAVFGLGALICAALLAFALYLQYWHYLDPCPLCIFQRIAFMALGLVFLVGALHGPRRRGARAAYGVLGAAAAGVGAGIAGRHVWLQSLPASEVPACSSLGLDYMVDTMPLGQVVARVLSGSGECAVVDWSFLGLSMPAWALVWFVLLGAGALGAGLRRTEGVLRPAARGMMGR